MRTHTRACTHTRARAHACKVQTLLNFSCLPFHSLVLLCLLFHLFPPPPAIPPTPSPQYVPQWVAPNLLTFTGWLMVMFNFALLSYYDPDYLTTYNTVGVVRPPIPRWVWLFCGVSHFVSYTLDGIDGKQARRTKSATPLGERLGRDSLRIWY